MSTENGKCDWVYPDCASIADWTFHLPLADATSQYAICGPCLDVLQILEPRRRYVPFNELKQARLI